VPAYASLAARTGRLALRSPRAVRPSRTRRTLARMDLASASDLIIEYRYWILIPLALIEGPIVAFVAGTLATLGYFNVYSLGIFFLLRDTVMDGFYYALVYYGGRSAFAQRLMRGLGVQATHLKGMQGFSEKHPGKTMFVGKLSYGIASTFVVLAGMVKMPLKKFFGWGATVAILQYWSLLALGYFFGASLSPRSEHIVETIPYAVAVIALLACVYYLFSWYMRKEWQKKTGQK
jgi:membrane protein DedA with SNARE-associated domain